MKVENIDQVEAWSPQAILQPGTHYVRVESVEEGTSSGGHPQLEMEFVSEMGMGSIRDWMVVIPESYGKVRQLLDACNIEPSSGEWELPIDRIAGSKLYVTVQEQPKFDNPTELVKKVVAYQSFDANDLPPGATVSTGQPQGRAEDDIPF